jgi:hypothetical protein
LQSITIPGGSSVVGNFGLSGNLQFLGSAQRITGDFSNATQANRLSFQSSTSNGNTTVTSLPNGTATVSGFLALNNSDPTNSAFVAMATAGGIEARFSSSILGTGTYLPMTFHTGGSEQARITTAGLFQFNSGYGSVATAYGARAWVNFNGTGTVAIRGSGNVSSITDNGTGDYTVNFTNAMPDVNYNMVATVAGAGTGQLVGVDAVANPTQTTSSVRAVFGRTGASPFTILDTSYVAVSIFR